MRCVFGFHSDLGRRIRWACVALTGALLCAAYPGCADRQTPTVKTTSTARAADSAPADATAEKIAFNVHTYLAPPSLVRQLKLAWNRHEVTNDSDVWSPQGIAMAGPPAPPMSAALIGQYHGSFDSTMETDILGPQITSHDASIADGQTARLPIAGVNPPVTLVLSTKLSRDRRTSLTSFHFEQGARDAAHPEYRVALAPLAPPADAAPYALEDGCTFVVSGGMYGDPAHPSLPARQLIVALQPTFPAPPALIPASLDERRKKAAGLLADARTLFNRSQFHDAAGTLRLAREIDPENAAISDLLKQALEADPVPPPVAAKLPTTAPATAPATTQAIVRVPPTHSEQLAIDIYEAYHRSKPELALFRAQQAVLEDPHNELFACLLHEAAIDVFQRHDPAKLGPKWKYVEASDMPAPIAFEIVPVLVGEHAEISNDSRYYPELVRLLGQQNVRMLNPINVSLRDKGSARFTIDSVNPKLTVELTRQQATDPTAVDVNLTVTREQDPALPLAAGVLPVNAGNRTLPQNMTLTDYGEALTSAGMVGQIDRPDEKGKQLYLHVRAIFPALVPTLADLQAQRRAQVASLILDARGLYDKKDYAQSTTLLNKALDLDPKNEVARRLLKVNDDAQAGRTVRLTFDVCTAAVPPTLFDELALKPTEAVGWYLSEPDRRSEGPGNARRPPIRESAALLLDDVTAAKIFSAQAAERGLFFEDAARVTIDSGAYGEVGDSDHGNGLGVVPLIDADHKIAFLRMAQLLIHRDPFRQSNSLIDPAAKVEAVSTPIELPLDRILAVQLPSTIIAGGWSDVSLDRPGRLVLLMHARVESSSSLPLPADLQHRYAELLATAQMELDAGQGAAAEGTLETAKFLQPVDPVADDMQKRAHALASISTFKWEGQQKFEHYLDSTMDAFDVEKAGFEAALRKLIDPAVDPLAQRGTSFTVAGGVAGQSRIMPWSDLEPLGVTDNTLVTVHLKNTTRRKALEAILAAVSPPDNPADYTTEGSHLSFRPLFPQDFRGFPSERRLSENYLQRKIAEVAVENIPLNTLLDALRGTRRPTPIVVDWKSLEAAGIRRDMPISLVLSDTTYGSALKAIFAQIQQKYDTQVDCIDVGGIQISTQTEIAAMDAFLNRRVLRVLDTSFAPYNVNNQDFNTASNEISRTWAVPLALDLPSFESAGIRVSRDTTTFSLSLPHPTLREIVQGICDALGQKNHVKIAYTVTAGTIILSASPADKTP